MSIDKIKGNLTSKTSSSKKSSKAGGAKATGSTSATTEGAKSDGARQGEGVSVSSSGVSDALASDKASRAARVAALKLEVDRGSYEVDPQKTADRLIDSLSDYSLA